MSNRYKNRDSVFLNAKFTAEPRRIIYDPSSSPILTWDKENPSWLCGTCGYSTYNIYPHAFTTVKLADGYPVCLSHYLNSADDVEIFEAFKKRCAKRIDPDPLSTSDKIIDDRIDMYHAWQVIFSLPSSRLLPSETGIPHMRIVACSLNVYLKHYEEGFPIGDYRLTNIFYDRASRIQGPVQKGKFPDMILQLQRKDDCTLATLVMRFCFPQDIIMDSRKINNVTHWIIKNAQGNLGINTSDNIFMDPTDDFCFTSDIGNILQSG